MKYSAADAITGVNASDVTILSVSAPQRRRLKLSLSASNTIIVGYEIEGSPGQSFTSMSTQLEDAVNNGQFDQSMSKYSAVFGAPGFADTSSVIVSIVDVTPATNDDGDDGDDGGGGGGTDDGYNSDENKSGNDKNLDIGLVVGVVVAAAIVITVITIVVIYLLSDDDVVKAISTYFQTSFTGSLDDTNSPTSKSNAEKEKTNPIIHDGPNMLSDFLYAKKNSVENEYFDDNKSDLEDYPPCHEGHKDSFFDNPLQTETIRRSLSKLDKPEN